jgi:hypothetical protein
MDAFASGDCRSYEGRGNAALVEADDGVSIYWQPSNARDGSWIRLGSLDPSHAWSRFEGIAELDGTRWMPRAKAA